MVRSGSSYLSQSELVLTFGLGNKSKVDAIEVQWPSGQVDHVAQTAADQTITVEEGRGVVNARAYGKVVDGKPHAVAKSTSTALLR
jgi:enediyne biosynthesis protein E4